jgi:ATP synthase protein I
MAEDEFDEVPKLPPDARLESLDERLDRLQQAEAERDARKQGNAGNRAGRLVVSQLVGGPVGGAIVGWVLDQWLGTAPWLLLGLMFIGFAGGFISVMRISGRSAGNGPNGQG